MIDGYDFYYLNCFMLVIYRLMIKEKNRFLFVACLQIFLVLAFRSTEVCIDAWYQYPDVYRGASKLEFSQLISGWSLLKQSSMAGPFAECGYISLNWIFGHLLGLPYRAFVIFLALFAAYTLYKYLKRNSFSPFLGALTAYIYLLNGNAYFSAIRRSTAMNFIMLAFMAMEDKNIKKAALLLLASVTMHRSALIIFLFLPFVNMKITRELFRKVVILIFAVGIFALILVQTILPFILSYLGKAFYFYGSGGAITIGTHLELKAVAGVAILWFIYWGLDFNLLNTDYNNMLCKIFLFIIIFSPVQTVIPLLTQVHNYFTLSCFLLVENIIVQRRENKIIKTLMWSAVMIFLVLVLVRNIEGWRKDGDRISSSYYRTILTSRYGD